MLEYGAIGLLLGFGIGWFGNRFYLLRGGKKLDLQGASLHEYEVYIYQTTHNGPVGFLLYAGNDLQEAKRIYREATGPKSSLVEFYTHGFHTAGRRVE